MPRSVIGIDIRKTSISAVHLISGFKQTEVKNFARIRIVSDDEQNGSLEKGLKALAERIDFGNAAVVAAIPANQVIFRNLQVPFDDPKKIRQILPFELEPTLPLAVEATVIDFEVIKTVDNNLLTAAVEKSLLERHLKALEQAGIRPSMIVPSGYPLALRVVQNQLQKGDGLLIDTEDGRLSIFLITEGYVGTVRTLQLPMNTAERIENSLNLVRQAILAFALRYNRPFKPEKIWLTGSGLANKSILQRISKKLEHPLDFVDLSKTLPELKLNGASGKWQPPLMDNALALALLEAEGGQSLNFYQRRSTLMTTFGEHRKKLVATAVLALLVCILALGKIGIETARLQQRVKLLDENIARIYHQAFPGTKRLVDPLHQMKVGLEKERKLIEGPTSGPSPLKMIDVLAKVSSCIDPRMKVRLTRLVAGAESITIAGKTTGFKIVDTIKNRLEKMEGFEKVTITSATTDKRGNQVQFKLRIKPAESGRAER